MNLKEVIRERKSSKSGGSSACVVVGLYEKVGGE